jgi:hypothetical protein
MDGSIARHQCTDFKGRGGIGWLNRSGRPARYQRGLLSQLAAEDVGNELAERMQYGVNRVTNHAAHIAGCRVGVEQNARQDPGHNNCPVFIHGR